MVDLLLVDTKKLSERGNPCLTLATLPLFDGVKVSDKAGVLLV